jgi:transposase
MAKPLVSDALWEAIAPLLPPEPPKPKGGRPRVSDRAALTGILFVLKTGLPWEYLPQELGCGSGVTCWRRLRDWQQAGVWHRLHLALLDQLGQADQIDWTRASLDASSVPAKGGEGRTKRLARTRRIAANRAASAIWWSTARASRSRSGSRRPTSTTRSSSKS